MSESEVSARVLAFDAVVRTAIEHTGKARWSRTFKTGAVTSKIDGEVSERTVRRALHDAHSLGWVDRGAARSRRWTPGPLAERYEEKEDEE